MMPTYSHLLQVAKAIRKQLDDNEQAFTSMPRLQVTEMLRATAQEDGTRLKRAMGAELEGALLNQGIRCFPALTETTTGDTIRFFRAGSVVSSFVDMVLHPSPETDKELAAALSKVKGKWDWHM